MFFFTVVTYERQPILCWRNARAILRRTIRECRERWPFEIEGIVLLPDHLHTMWTLPEGDSNYSRRLAWIKRSFTEQVVSSGLGGRQTTAAQGEQRRRGIWQARFWEHTIRDERDLEHHLDYIHYNPVKHGYVNCPRDWPYSSFHRYVREQVYPQDWGCSHVDFDREGLDGVAKNVGE